MLFHTFVTLLKLSSLPRMLSSTPTAKIYQAKIHTFSDWAHHLLDNLLWLPFISHRQNNLLSLVLRLSTLHFTTCFQNTPLAHLNLWFSLSNHKLFGGNLYCLSLNYEYLAVPNSKYGLGEFIIKKWMHEWMNEWMNGWMISCICLRDLIFD